MVDVTIQILVISIISTIGTIFVGWQSYRLGQILNSNFGKWESAGWFVAILYRGYGLMYLSDDVTELRKAGYIVGYITFRQWVTLLGYLVFLILMAIGKHLKRREICRQFGV